MFYLLERECDELPNPEHGVVQMTGRLFSDKATYSCEIGYQLIGRDHRTCRATGSWSGVEPFCKQSGQCFLSFNYLGTYTMRTLYYL